jgi:hypothetical protein
LIPQKKPSAAQTGNDADAYWSYKGHVASLLLAICDANGLFFYPTPFTHAEQPVANPGETSDCLDPYTYACTVDVTAAAPQHSNRPASTASLTAEAPEHNQRAASPYSNESCVALDANAVQQPTCLSAAESLSPPL